MSSAATTSVAPVLDWALIGRQIQGLFRLELGRQLFSRRALQLYLLAFVPVFLVTLWAITEGSDDLSAPIEASPVFAVLFAVYLRIPIFFGCLVLFMNLFRSEILERSLHYLFLTPVRREVVVAGKYIAALFATAMVFVLGTALLYLATFSPWGLGELSRHLFQGPGLGHLMSYAGIAVLACIGYGAIFLLAGLVVKNPVVIGIFFWGWEFLNPFLPALLKKLSVVFYLRNLMPVPLPDGPFAVLADPISPWISVPGLLLFTAAVLAIAAWRARGLEIHYGGED
ncbi:MAG: hypothetical protein AAGE94_02105 [Acidobacteriota bacterium]